MPGVDGFEKNQLEAMPAAPEAVEGTEDPMAKGVTLDTDSKLAKVLSGAKLD